MASNTQNPSGLAGALRRLLQRMRGASRPVDSEPLSQIDAALDGGAAVAVTEACITEAAALSNSYPATSSVQTFRRELARDQGANLLGDPVSAVSAADARAAVAAASGLASSGVRATAFVSGANLASVQDQLIAASGKHLPLVVQVACRATAGPGSTLGSGHEGYCALSEAGCVQLFATSVQESVDLAIVARRVAEAALVPAVVAIDGEQTADSLQQVKLPSAELVAALLGSPDEQIDCPTPAQRLLHGERRRRVPRLFDLVRPMLSGPHLGPEVRGLAAAGQRPYFLDHLPALVESALAACGEATGREYGLLCEHGVADAQIVMVAQGAAVETARAVCDLLRLQHRLRVGVLGVRVLRPLPGAQLVELLRGKRQVWVLERMDSPLAGEPPLTRDLRLALQRGLENGRHGRARHAGYPAISAEDQPRLSTAVYGIGGHPLRAADLVALVNADQRQPRSLVYLGVDFDRADTAYPKRKALIEGVRRAYPALAGLGPRAASRPLDLGPDAAVAAAVYRFAGQGGEGVVDRAGRLLLRAGGQLRARRQDGWQAWAALRCDRLVYCPRSEPALRDPGDEPLVDAVLIAAGGSGGQIPAGFDPTASLRVGGALVIESSLTDEQALWNALPEPIQRGVKQQQLALYRVAVAEDPTLRGERLAGVLLHALRAAVGDKLAVKPRKLLAEHQDLAQEELTGDHAGVDASACCEAFRQGLEEALIRIERPPAPREASREEPGVPGLVRRTGGDAGPDSLPAFWSEVGVLYRTGELEQLFAEPRLATGLLPALTAALASHADRGQALLPAFDPEPCTGCGRCWVACPEGAVGPVAHTPKTLLEAGMAVARAAGTDASALTMMVSKLAPKVVSALKPTAGDPPRTAGELLRGAPAELLARAPLPDDRKQGIVAAFEAVVAQLADLPLARTAPLFDAAEAEAPGNGALLSLAIDPDACKACGLCVAVCAPGALTAVAADAVRTERARRLWQLWERLPDTPGEVIGRARKQSELGELGALLLSRHCLLAMSGGDSAEPGSGARVALRLTLAVAEYELQRRLQRYVGQVGDLLGELAAKVRETFAATLPTADLERLADRIEAVARSHADLGEVCAQIGSDALDVGRLKELVSAGKDLAALHRRLSQGPSGLGRARCTLAFAPDTLSHGIATYPCNPFSMPAAIDSSGETAAFARGLLEGQLRQTTEELRAIRRARLALGNPTEAALSATELQRLGFADLTAEERQVCPPLLLVGSSASFSDQALAPLLAANLPVKVVLLADGALAADGAPADRDALSLLALAGGRAFVAQSSIAHGPQLVEALLRAMAHDGPAVVQVYAPSPIEHGFDAAATMTRAEAAVAARVFPLLSFDPAAEGVFGTCLEIGANPEPDADWCAGQTPVHWAASERRFTAGGHLSAPSDDAPSPTPLLDYLALEPPARSGKTPVFSLGEAASERRLVPSRQLLQLTENRLRAWRTLQELAGRVTPFVARVRAEAEAELRAAHDQELVALRQELEQQLARLQLDQATELTQRVRDRLLQLAGFGAQAGRSSGSSTEKPA